MADDTLQKANSLVKAGKDSEARGLLYHLVKTDPRNEMAWLWLSETMNESQRKISLEQASKFNPESKKIQHALERLRAKEEPAASKPLPPPEEEPHPAPSVSAPPVDRSTMKTARLTFLPEDEPEWLSPPARIEPPPAAPQDRSQTQPAHLPPMPSQNDRSVMRAARYDISPDTLTPDKLPPELQLPEKPVSTPAPKRDDQIHITTSQLTFVDLLEIDDTLAPLVTGEEAVREPWHRWLPYRQKFSPGLVRRFLRGAKGPILPPFGASATTEGDSPGTDNKELADARTLGQRVAEVAKLVQGHSAR